MNRAWALLLFAAVAALFVTAIVKSAPAKPSSSPGAAGSGSPSPSGPPTQATGSVVVTVSDGSSPIADARIVLGSGRGRTELDARCGVDGSCRFARVPAGRWTVSAHHPRFAPATTAIEVTEGREVPVALSLIAGGKLAGIVRDGATGQPVADAAILLLDPQTRLQRSTSLHTRSNERGEYALDQVPLGRSGLRVLAPNFRPFERLDLDFARNGEALAADVLLKAGTTVGGRVLDASGAPVAGAMISGSNEHTADGVSDAEGRFTLTGLGDAPVNLFVVADGFGTTYVRNIAPFTPSLEVRLLRPGTLAGRIVVQPLPKRFTLLFYRFDPDFQKPLLVLSHQATKGDGSFTVAGLSEGRYTLKVQAEGYTFPVDADVSVRAGETVNGLEIAGTANPQ